MAAQCRQPFTIRSPTEASVDTLPFCLSFAPRNIEDQRRPQFPPTIVRYACMRSTMSLNLDEVLRSEFRAAYDQASVLGSVQG